MGLISKKNYIEPIKFKTTMNPEEALRFLKTANESSLIAEQIYRGCHGGGCPAPNSISKKGLLSYFSDFF